METEMQKCKKRDTAKCAINVSNNSGFTMIELMVVLAIMAILTMVAYPSYQESMRKSRRSDAIVAALAIQVAQEKFRSSCTVYASTIAAANNCNTPTVGVYSIPGLTTSPEGHYTMSLSGATGNAYVITAAAQGAQANDTGCTSMTITFNATNPNGLKQPVGCWP